MKRIILVRHATAVSSDVTTGDYERSLRKKGRREAKAMAEWYKGAAQVPGKMISSPANRAIETAHIFAKVLGYPAKKILRKKQLYSGLSSAEFLEQIKALSDKQSSVMLFGHDPDFSDFAQYLADGFRESLPKCAVFGVAVDTDSWRKIQTGEGQVEFFEHPQKLLDRAEQRKKTRRDVTTRIERSILDALFECGIELRGDGARAIHRASAKLVKVLSLEPRGESGAAPKKATRKSRAGKAVT